MRALARDLIFTATAIVVVYLVTHSGPVPADLWAFLVFVALIASMVAVWGTVTD